MNPIKMTDYIIFIVSLLLATSLMFNVAGHMLQVFAAGTLLGASLLRVLIR